MCLRWYSINVGCCWRFILQSGEIKGLKVSHVTEPKKLAGTIKDYLNKGCSCEIKALGQQSICITVKSIALLSSMFNVQYNCSISYFNEENSDVAGIQFNLNP